MGEAELKLALESLRGELKRLDTVVKMSMAEQRRVNSEMGLSLGRQTSLVEALDERLDRLHQRLAAYTGGLAALWVVFQVISRTLLR
jgi:hypothetical protein